MNEKSNDTEKSRINGLSQFFITKEQDGNKWNYLVADLYKGKDLLFSYNTESNHEPKGTSYFKCQK